MSAPAADKSRESTAEKERIWDISPDMLIVLTQDGLVRAANPAWERILGYTEQDLVGHHFRQFVHPDDLPHSLARIARFTNGPFTPTENRYRHKDGTLRIIAWAAVAEGGLIYAIGRDITAEKRQAEAFAKTEEALRQSQKMEAVGQLTAGIAHDFNNLLQSISSGVELMRRRLADGRPQEAERFVEAAQKAIERAAALTHRLLAFSRRQALSPKRVNIGDLLRGMSDLLRETVGPSIEFLLRLQANTWPVCCEPNQLENAILNLAINARDAMPEGGTLLIETEHVALSEADVIGATGARPGEYVLITTRDTGTGMPQDVRERAFEPFFTTKAAGQGTGLGLSQVYGFISQSSGVIRLESAPGKGTAVLLYIPRDMEAGADFNDASSLLAAAPPRAISRATVLLVDADIARARYAETLRTTGCQVVEAADGPAALNALRDALRHDGTGIDLLISDIGLPGWLNGRQLADVARDMLPDLPIIFLTGDSNEPALPGLPPGMVYLQKPCAPEALTTQVRAMLLT